MKYNNNKKVWALLSHTHTHTHTQRGKFYDEQKQGLIRLILFNYLIIPGSSYTTMSQSRPQSIFNLLYRYKGKPCSDPAWSDDGAAVI